MKKLILSLVCILAIGCSPMAKAQVTDKPTSVTMKANDFDVKNVLTTIFLQAKVKNYSIANDVQGKVTFELTEQSLENTLKIICRLLPMTYSKIDDTYIIEMRKIPTTFQSLSPIIPELTVVETTTKKNTERITLMYLDPMDLNKIFGPFNYVQSFSRFRNMNTNNNGDSNRPG